MGLSDYHFTTRWSFKTRADEAYDLLSRPEHFHRWVKSFPIHVEPITPGNADGIGRTERFTVKSYLPYSLSWQMECIEAARPHRIVSKAEGDLNGRGIWSFEQKGSLTDVVFDWKIKVQKPLLRYTGFILKPLFMWNHDWVMDRWKSDLEGALSASRQPAR